MIKSASDSFWGRGELIFALDFTREERGEGDWCLCWVMSAVRTVIYVVVLLNTSRWMLIFSVHFLLDRFCYEIILNPIHNTTSLACIVYT